MIKAKFNNLMLENLKKIKGSKLLCYLTDDMYDGNVSYGKVGLETNNGCLDVYNEETSVDWFDIDGEKTKEDISMFSCKERKEGEEFVPYINKTNVIRHEVDEYINSIKIVTDFVRINNEEYSIDYDIAIIIKTDSHKYTISRGWLFSEEIYISIDDDCNDIYSITDEINDWNNDGDYSVEVKRTIKEI